MRMPWTKPKSTQLELLDAESVPAESTDPHTETVSSSVQTPSTGPTRAPRAKPTADANAGKPLLVAVLRLIEDPNNPRSEFPEAEIEELAEDIRQRGILQPLVVHSAQGDGRHCIHFGAKRLRAAIRAGLHEVPVVVRDVHADRYAQVAENQKRHGLSPLDMARFIRAQVDAGDSNATVARQLGMNLTTVAHHLALLDLSPELDEALKSGRCTSPRTLHELSQLHVERPEQVRSLIAGEAEITRSAVSALRSAPADVTPTAVVPPSSNKLIARAYAACDRLERALGRIRPTSADEIAQPELIALRIRVEDITRGWLQGSDRQTPPHADR